MGLWFDRLSRNGWRRTRRATAAAAIAAAFAIALPAFGAAPVPAAGVATVDGDASEWVAGDFFSVMKSSGSTSSWGTLSLRYDCDSHVLSALVSADVGVTFRADRPENAYLRIDGVGKLVSGESGDDGTPPDFAWVALDGNGAQGFEASGIVAPGEHTIRAHILMADDSADGYLSLDSDPRTGPLSLHCEAPSGSPPASPSPSPSGGVGTATGVPVTPPPTDAADLIAGSWTVTAFLMIVVGLAVIDLAALKVARARQR